MKDAFFKTAARAFGFGFAGAPLDRLSAKRDDFGFVAALRERADARAALGDQAFDRWVERTLAITPAEAVALIRFAQDPAIVMADVSPIKAMTLTDAMQLVVRLDDHLDHQQ